MIEDENNVSLIRVNNDGIIFNDSISLTIIQSNIPCCENMTFDSDLIIFWKVKTIGYETLTKTLIVKIVHYKPYDTSTFSIQKSKVQIERIEFIGFPNNFNWIFLRPVLSYYNYENIKRFLYNIDTPNRTDNIETPNIIDQTIREISYIVEFINAYFESGYIRFKGKINEHSEEFEIKVINGHLRPEYENIKAWFPKILKKDVFNVKVTVGVIANKMDIITATSSEIDKITPDLIDGIRYQRISRLFDKETIQQDNKALFTAEEIFPEGNVFNDSENDILKLMIKNEDIPHKMQLAYLSEKQSLNHKLLFTLDPNFGYLFFIEEKEKNYFVWELQEEYATYIWSVFKVEEGIKEQLKQVEKCINYINNHGRENYKFNRNELGLEFSQINHEDINIDINNAFIKWKRKITDQLI